jgi:hypothetical protein
MTDLFPCPFFFFFFFLAHPAWILHWAKPLVVVDWKFSKMATSNGLVWFSDFCHYFFMFIFLFSACVPWVCHRTKLICFFFVFFLLWVYHMYWMYYWLAFKIQTIMHWVILQKEEEKSTWRTFFFSFDLINTCTCSFSSVTLVLRIFLSHANP